MPIVKSMCTAISYVYNTTPNKRIRMCFLLSNIRTTYTLLYTSYSRPLWRDLPVPYLQRFNGMDGGSALQQSHDADN